MRCHRPRAGARGARRTAWRSLPVRRAFRSDPPPSLLRSHAYGQRSPAARPSISTLAITAGGWATDGRGSVGLRLGAAAGLRPPPPRSTAGGDIADRIDDRRVQVAVASGPFFATR